MKDVLISCNSKEEYNSVLEKLEKLGCVWASGDKPTERGYYSKWCNKICVTKKVITTGTYRPSDYEQISADDYIGNEPIVIYRVGRNVVALDQNTNKSAIAKCHPSDNFNFSVGAKIAFERLLGCNPVADDNKGEAHIQDESAVHKYNIGDRVRLKRDLVIGRTYGMMTFCHEMYTKDVMTIRDVRDSGNYDCRGWYYSPEMLEPFDGYRVGDIVTVDLSLVVGNKYDGITLLENMACFGKPLEIKSVDKSANTTYYTCTNGFDYTESMLRPFDDEITIGSTIKVLNNSFSYDSYAVWVDKNVSDPMDKVRFDYGSYVAEGSVGKVIAIAPHMANKEDKLIYFEHNDKCYLINSKGVKKSMGKTGELGKRMKAYEGAATKKLVKKLPVIIRVDGRAFHTFTRKLNKPFDDLLIDAMEYTLQYLCKNVTGCVFGYMQSDEISLLVQDYKSEETQPWFEYRVDKLCSITASMATFAFNRAFENYTTDFYNACSESESAFKENEERIKTLLECCNKGAVFDARAFTLPFNEVTNYFYWRQADAMRNSVEMVGHANFSAKELHKVNTNGIKRMLLEKAIDYDKLTIPKQRGICCIKTKIPSFAPDGHAIMRTTWVNDINIPVFKGDGREYIESKIGDTYY